jgi:hypothetical protein
MKSALLLIALLLIALAFAVAGCNRKEVKDDDATPPVNTVQPEVIVQPTSNVAPPLTNVPTVKSNPAGK